MVARNEFFIAGATAAFLLFALPNAANAQEAAVVQPAGPAVSCLVEPAKLPADAVERFLQSPMALLTDETTGAAVNSIVLASRVRALSASSSATLDMLLELVKNASDLQIAAIGAGLSRAAQACVGENAEYAALIQSKVAELNNATLLAAFSGAADEIQTAALGGGAGTGAGAGASGIGGGGVAGGGTAGIGGDEGTPQGVDSFSTNFQSRNFFASDDDSLSPSSP